VELQVRHANFVASAFPCIHSAEGSQHAGSAAGAPAPRPPSQLASGPVSSGTAEAKTGRAEAKSQAEDKTADAA
jgi:hypothetical protein